MNTLGLRYDVDGEQLMLRPVVDGQDLVGAYRNDQGRNPDDLLPPTSAVLLPTGVGRVAVIGVCGCGFAGCGSLSTQILRFGDEVVWAPVSNPDDETLSRTYRFDLRQHLDAVDHAAGEPPSGEGRGRRVGRAVRVLLERYEQLHGSLLDPVGGSVDRATGWPWTSDVVRVAVTVDGQQEVLEFAPQPRETEAAFARRIIREIGQRSPVDGTCT